MRTIVLSVVLVGCGGGLTHYKPPKTTPDGTNDEDSGTTPDDTEPPPPDSAPTTDTESTPIDTETTPTPGFEPELDAVEPDFGSDAGGTIIELTGSFDPNTDVYVGGTSTRIVSANATRITAEVPAGTPGWADVEVVSGANSAVLNNAFQYFEDGAGRTGIVGDMGYLEYLGDYWDVANPPPLAWSYFAFVEPASWEPWKDYAPNIGQCRYNYVSTEVYTEQRPGAASVQLDNGARVLTLSDQSADIAPGWYGDALVPDVEVIPGDTYDLQQIAGNSNWPEFDMPSLVHVPNAFRVTTPNLNANNLPSANRGLRLDWNGGGGDYMLIYLGRTTATGVADGYVTCAVNDTGSFTVPSNTWPNWYQNGILYIQVGRVQVGTTVVPYDNSSNLMAGIYWSYGAALTQ